mmetsp:Transcript_112370/g.317587  ORF Transcript_112370/g.317587 Transcript_112370/m.317587 type:complete len:564 (-) Transcript_112370:67-1758(-)
MPSLVAPLEGRRATASESASDLEAELAAWRAAAVTAIVALALVYTTAIVVYVWSRQKAGSALTQELRRSDAGDDAGGDVEKGDGKATTQATQEHVPDRANTELCNALREMLRHEISKGLQHDGVPARLDRLEGQDRPKDDALEECREDDPPEDISRNQGKSSESLGPPECQAEKLRGGEPGLAERLAHLEQQLRSSGSVPAPNQKSSESGGAALQPQSPLHSPAENPDPPDGDPPAPGMRKRPLCHTGVGTDPEMLADFGQSPTRRRASGCVPGASFGPTLRQRRQADPPERVNMHLNSKTSLKASSTTVQRQLQRRESQAVELRRQILECQDTMATQRSEAEGIRHRLEAVLHDPSLAPQMQAEEIEALREEKESLTARLEVQLRSENYWAMLVRHQRAFFVQSDRIAQAGGPQLLCKHSAGELFVEPPPVPVEGDEEDLRKLPWDVGTSNMNPYVTDSWPFEPNVLAQRLVVEPSLHRCEEEDEQDLDDEDEDEEEEEEDEEQEEEEEEDAESEEDVDPPSLARVASGSSGERPQLRPPLRLPEPPAVEATGASASTSRSL